MNPHFIFNALNTIKGYYTQGNLSQASIYISKFSKLLRKLLESEEQITTLDNEIEMLRLYIDLTQIRYENKFSYTIETNSLENLNNILIPNLLLQPLVENAIIHGLSPKIDFEGKLLVDFKIENESLICTVDDNGIGREASLKKQLNKEHNSKALSIIEERILLFDKSSSIKYIDKFDNQIAIGTKVIITIPLKTKW